MQVNGGKAAAERAAASQRGQESLGLGEPPTFDLREGSLYVPARADRLGFSLLVVSTSFRAWFRLDLERRI